MPKAKNKALDWAKRCAESKGTSFLVPKNFKEEAEKFLAEVESLNADKKALIRREADFSNLRDNFWYNLRKELEKGGATGVFEKNIDFDADAKADGFFVVNIFDERQGMPMGLPRRK